MAPHVVEMSDGGSAAAPAALHASPDFDAEGGAVIVKVVESHLASMATTPAPGAAGATAPAPGSELECTRRPRPAPSGAGVRRAETEFLDFDAEMPRTLLSMHGVGYSVDEAAAPLEFGLEALQRGQLPASLPKTRQKVLLHGISASARSGECMAIMGPSGSGKSTFLDIVAGRKSIGTVTGRVLLNGEPLVEGGEKNLRLLQRATSYVTQDDVLLEHLTVRETFMYAARLTLPASATDAERAARVDDVIAELGLIKAADTLIGGYFRRGVSGGEKRRVSIGVELIRSPLVLLLDEPTSGLSSADAYGIVDVVKGMAEAGHTVVCTIHQPSDAVFSMFDALLLLAAGRAAYFGPAAGAVAHFESLGYPLAGRAVSPAEFLIETVSPPIGSAALAWVAGDADGAFRRGRRRRGRRPALEQGYAAGAKTALQPGASHQDMMARLESRLEDLASRYSESDLGRRTLEELSQIESKRHARLPAPLGDSLPDRVGFWRQTAVLCGRNCRLLFRDFTLFLAICLQGIVVASLSGSLFRTNEAGAASGLDQSEMLRYQGLFMVCLMITYSFFAVVDSLLAERGLMNREVRSGSYSLYSYFLAKTLVSLPQNCIVLLPLAMIMHGFLQLNPGSQSTGFYVLLAMAFSNVAGSVTELCSALASSASAAIVVSNGLVVRPRPAAAPRPARPGPGPRSGRPSGCSF
eukprot:tig00020904_g15161.t1